jgi:CheY-like chemotaxis protein
MASRPPGESLSAASLSPRLPGSGRVLVIEDEPVIRETIQMLIDIEGCEARGVPDARAALALLADWTPDLILVDYSLLIMSGEEFIRAYHSTAGPHAPIILLTARDISGADATAMGATGVLPKPFDANDLLDLVAGFTECSGD